ncbi:MAG: lysophospholipid acyltransferase family protein [Bacteroidota bacterium]
MIKFLRRAHWVYSIVIILVLSCLFYPFYYAFSRNEKWYVALNLSRKLHSVVCSLLIGVFFVFEFERPLLKNQTFIYCANHTSNLDIMMLCILGHGRFHFLGKQELLNNPVLKLFFNTIDVPVNRDSKMSSFRAFKKVGENLDKGMSLMIFPEGRIDEDHYPPQLLPFKNGPFRLAIEKNIAIVPITFIDAWKRMWDDGSRHGTTPGFCHIYVHKPIATSDLDIADADVLKDAIFAIINSKFTNNDHR